MKILYFLLLGIFLHVLALSQTVALRFEGAANSNNINTRNYEVNLDGKKYYSSNADFIGTSRDKQILLNDLQLDLISSRFTGSPVIQPLVIAVLMPPYIPTPFN